MKQFINKLMLNRHIEKAAIHRKKAFLYSAIDENRLAEKHDQKVSFHNRKINKYLKRMESFRKKRNLE